MIFICENKQETIVYTSMQRGTEMGFPSSQDYGWTGSYNYVHLEKPRAMIAQGATNHQPSCPPAVTQWKPSLSDSSGSFFF